MEDVALGAVLVELRELLALEAREGCAGIRGVEDPLQFLAVEVVEVGEDGSRAALKIVTVFLKNEKEWFRLHRNVAKGNLEIEVLDEMRLPIEGALVDVSGQVLRQFNIQNGHGEVPVSGLPPGVYFLQLSNGYLRQVEKVVVGW